MKWCLTLIMFHLSKIRLSKNVPKYGNNTFMEENIIGGKMASIYNHPHSAFIAIHCELIQKSMNKPVIHVFCGSSIINQYFLLTAAHCLKSCHRTHSDIDIAVGTEYLKNITHLGAGFQIHRGFSERPPKNDVGLVKVNKPLIFSKNVKKVIIMRQPLQIEVGYVAGWGLSDGIIKRVSLWLKEAPQRIPRRDECLRDFPNMPEYAFCAKQIDDNGYPITGDSGSGLIVNNSTIFGIVSYHKSSVIGTEVYANVSYFYDWIVDTMLSHC